jgi:predicted regulator of Ras-like GTPase activity (Roadblock/LC7/MglB family)
MSNAVKTKFAGLLRSLLRRFDDGEANAGEPARPVTAGAPTAPASPVLPEQPAHSQPAFVPPPVSANPDELRLPLQPVLAALPMELRAKVVPTNTAGLTISIPVEKALAQLATGSVKITFGELRHAVPGVFVNSGGEYDARPVTLPLNHVLAQINPALLSRRSAQKQVAVADDIAGPFDARGQGFTFSTTSLKPAPAVPPHSRITVPVSETPVQPPSAFIARSTAPAAPTNNAPRNGNGAIKPPFISSAPIPFKPVAPVPPAAALPEQSQPIILAPLAALSEDWPEALRMEITQMSLANSQVALPVHLIEPALKRGRVIFSWRYVRSWIKPTPPAVSVHDGVELELPLKVLAPLFIARQKTSQSQRRIAVAEEIPNLFFGAPQPSAAPVEKPPDTNFFQKPGTVSISDTEFKRRTSPGPDFISRHSAPENIIARAQILEGVAGALVALPDGLMVAGKIPPEFNADTIAAFLPQLFGRVSQCSKELRMGELNNLSFTVGNVPWKIFRVHAVYFAAFGRAGQQLPTAQLAALAAELDHKKQ